MNRLFNTLIVLYTAGLSSSCAREEYLFSTPTGYVLAPADGQPPTGATAIAKIKARTVTLQIGGANNQQSAADNTRAGQRQGSAATAPNASASNDSTASGGSSWLWYLLAVIAGAVGWEVLRGKIPAKFLAWRGITS